MSHRELKHASACPDTRGVPTLFASTRLRTIVAIGGGCVVAVAALIGWIYWQNAQYDERLGAAFDPVIAEFAAAPTGLAEKEAIVAENNPQVVNTIRITIVILEMTQLPQLDRTLRALEVVDPPMLWKSHHVADVAFSRRSRAVLEARAARLHYANSFLGESPSVRKISKLAGDARYVELGEEADSAARKANRAASVLNGAGPLIASRFPGSPQFNAVRAPRADSGAEDDIALASTCATAELHGATAPSDRCAGLLRYVPETTGIRRAS